MNERGHGTGAGDAVYRRRRLAAIAALVVAALAVLLVLRGVIGGNPEEPQRPRVQAGGEQPPSTDLAATEPAIGEPGPDWKPSREPVPILMYHEVDAPPPDAGLPELYVDPGDFKAQMEWLADEGYEGVTMEQVHAAWEDGGLLPKRPVVISFDDGYRGQYDNALPVLEKLGWPGELYLQTHSASELPKDNELDPEMVREMIDSGWDLGAHTISHADLTTVDAAQLEDELVAPREALEQQFDVEVEHFCYPAGKYDTTVVEAVEDAGYETATTVEPGLGSRDEPYTLKRIRINGSAGLEGFVEALRSAGAAA